MMRPGPWLQTLGRQHLPPPGRHPFGVQAWALVNAATILAEAATCVWLADIGLARLIIYWPILTMALTAGPIMAMARGRYPGSEAIPPRLRFHAAMTMLTAPVTCALALWVWSLMRLAS